MKRALVVAALAVGLLGCSSTAGQLHVSAFRTYRLLDGWRQYYCVVTASNPTGSMVQVSNVQVGYYDSQGNQIQAGDVYLPVSGLAAGRSVSTNDGDLPGGTTECRALGWS
jgi:hypothetical protein